MPICREIPPPAGQRVGSFEACQAYIEGQECERPSHDFFQGVVSRETAHFEMDAHADLSRCKDPVCHWVISYQSDEPATNDVIEEDVGRLLEAIGLQRNQFVAAVHDDTDNRHVHVVANKVGPVGRAASLSWSVVRSERRMAEIALDRGVPIVPGWHNGRLLADQAADPYGLRSGTHPRLNGRERVRFERTGVLPWRIIKGPMIIEVARNAGGWLAFAVGLSRYGIVIKHRVFLRKDGKVSHGLAFTQGHGRDAPGCKASVIGASVCYTTLADRWGEHPDRAQEKARQNLVARRITGPAKRERTPQEGREAARQRREEVSGLGDLRPSLGRKSSVRSIGKLGGGQSGESPNPLVQGSPIGGASAPSIALQAAQHAADRILANLRTGTARSKRQRRRGKVYGQPAESRVPASRDLPSGDRQRSDETLATAQDPPQEGKVGVPNIADHASLQQEYVQYRAKAIDAARSEHEEIFRQAWVDEQGHRKSGRSKLRRSLAVKRRLAIVCLPLGPVRSAWLKFLQLRFDRKRKSLGARDRERWKTTRAELLRDRNRTKVLDYRQWLAEHASGNPAAARQLNWICSLSQPSRPLMQMSQSSTDDLSAQPPVGAAQESAGILGASDTKRREGETPLSVPDTAWPDSGNAVEPEAQWETDAVSIRDDNRSGFDMSPVHTRLLGAAKLARARAESALLMEMPIQHEDHPQIGTEVIRAAVAKDDIGGESTMSPTTIGLGSASTTLPVATDAMPQANMTPGVQGREAATPPGFKSVQTVVEGPSDTRLYEISDARYPIGEGGQTSQSTFYIGDQARQVAARPLTQAEGILPEKAPVHARDISSASRTHSHEARSEETAPQRALQMSSKTERYRPGIAQEPGAEAMAGPMASIGEQAREVALRSQALTEVYERDVRANREMVPRDTEDLKPARPSETEARNENARQVLENPHQTRYTSIATSPILTPGSTSSERSIGTIADESPEAQQGAAEIADPSRVGPVAKPAPSLTAELQPAGEATAERDALVEREWDMRDIAQMYADSQAYAESLRAGLPPLPPVAAMATPSCPIPSPAIPAKPEAVKQPASVSRSAGSADPSPQLASAAAAKSNPAAQAQELPAKSENVAQATSVPQPPIPMPDAAVSEPARQPASTDQMRRSTIGPVHQTLPKPPAPLSAAVEAASKTVGSASVEPTQKVATDRSAGSAAPAGASGLVQPAIKLLDPLAAFRGPANAQTRTVASTIIHAADLDDDALFQAATLFLARLTNASHAKAKHWGSRMIEWARVNGDRGKLPPPYKSREACDAARRNFERNNRGIGR